GGGMPAALNGANEVVVQAYLEDAFSFPQIAGILKRVMDRLAARRNSADVPACLRRIATVDDAVDADRMGRQLAAAELAPLRTASC
ncbi:MAG TPA: hypothetical protein VGC20_17065, partial [bacterium]